MTNPKKLKITSVFIFSVFPLSNLTLIDSKYLSPPIDTSWQGVFIETLPVFSSFLISFIVCWAPRNSSLYE